MYNKNDPLVHSVKAIMEQNEFRRRVETKLCEELGVFSRNALPHEHLANYDALLEQRMKEATDPSKYSEKQKKLARVGTESGHGGDPKKIDAPDLAGARKGHASHIEEEQLDELKGIKKDKEAAKKYIKKATHSVATLSASSRGFSRDSKDAADKQDYVNAKKSDEKADKTFVKSWRRRKYISKAVDKLEEQEQDSKNPLPPASAKERIQNKLGTGPKSSTSVSSDSTTRTQPSDAEKAAVKSKIENLDELSKAKVARYTTKAVDDVSHDSFIAGAASQSAKSRGTALEFDNKAIKRQKSVNLAIKKLSGSAKVNAKEEVELDEKKLTDAEMSKREEIVKSMKKGAKGFKSRYGERAKEVMYATATKQAKKLAEDNVSIDAVMEEIARNLGEEAFNKLMSEQQEPGEAGAFFKKPQPSVADRLSSGFRRFFTPRPTPAQTPAERDRDIGLSSLAQNPNAARGAFEPRTSTNLDPGVIASQNRASRGRFNPGDAARREMENDPQSRNLTLRSLQGGAALRPGEGGLSRRGTQQVDTDAAFAASDPIPSVSPSTPSRPATTTTAPESRPVPTGISDTASDERNAGAPRFAGAPTPPPRPAAAARPAAARPAAARPAATAAASVDQHAKSKSMFQAAQDREDRGESGGSAAFFAADKQRTAELRGMQESKSLTSTINKILKG